MVDPIHLILFICIGIVLIGIGLVVGLLGYRLLWVLLAFAGFACFAAISGFLLYFLFNSLTTFPPLVIPIGSFTLTINAGLYCGIPVALLLGIVGAILAVVLYYVGVFLLGSVLGLPPSVAFYVLCVFAMGRYFPKYDVFVVLLLMGISVFLVICTICGLLALWLQKAMVIAASSVLGGLLILAGLDFIFLLPLTSTVVYLVHRGPLPSDWWLSPIILIVAMAFVLIALCIQFLVTARNQKYKAKGCFLCFGSFRTPEEQLLDEELKVLTKRRRELDALQGRRAKERVPLLLSGNQSTKRQSEAAGSTNFMGERKNYARDVPTLPKDWVWGTDAPK